MEGLKVRPLGDRVIIKQDSGEQKNLGLSFSTAKPYRGVIMAVGDGNMYGQKVEMVCKVGDVVQYSGLVNPEVVIDNEKYVIIRESDLYLIE